MLIWGVMIVVLVVVFISTNCLESDAIAIKNKNVIKNEYAVL